MVTGFDILAARGREITDWMDLLVPLVLVGIYFVNWLVSKLAEAAKKDRDQAGAADTPNRPIHRPLKTSPLNRAVPRKRQQPTLSQTLGRLAGQIANQANPQAPRSVNPPAEPLPVAKRMPLPPRQVSKPGSQSAPESSASSGPVAFSKPRPQTSQVAHAAQRQAPIPHAQPRSQPVAATAKQPPKSIPARPPSKPPAAVQPHKAEPPAATAPAHFLGSFLGDRNNLAQAIILSEILGRPLALRSDGPDLY